MTLSDALHRWCEYRAKLRDLGLVAASTAVNQALIVLRLQEKLGRIDLAALRKSDVEIYIGERRKTCAPVTIQGELNVLRQVLNWCVDEQMLAARPRLPTVAVPKVETSLPSDEAFLWVLANVPPCHARALELMMLTGLSPHEIERLEVQDASAYRRMSDHFTFGSPGELGEIGIGQRPDFPVKTESRRRWVPLSNRARALWFESTVGMQPTTRPFPTVDAMQKAIRRAVSGGMIPGTQLVPFADLYQVTPKLMRKWFASKVAGDQPEHVLQKLLGHAPGSRITRAHYVRSTEDQAQRAVGGLVI